MVCIRASSMELSTPFLLSKARPANVQKRTCLMPTDTKCVSESGRNSATKILWVWPIQLATLAPDGQIRKKCKCDLSNVVWLYTVKRKVIYIYHQPIPSCHFQMVMVCSGSKPTDSRSFPVALKLTEQTPPEWKQRSTDKVCLVMASQTWIDGEVAEEDTKQIGIVKMSWTHLRTIWLTAYYSISLVKVNIEFIDFVYFKSFKFVFLYV